MFWIWNPWAEIWPFVPFYYEIDLESNQENKKWLYLSPGATNAKNRGTFCSFTLKIEEEKVPLFFGLIALGSDKAIFSYF